jgi:hypothetical protein
LWTLHCTMWWTLHCAAAQGTADTGGDRLITLPALDPVSLPARWRLNTIPPVLHRIPGRGRGEQGRGGGSRGGAGEQGRGGSQAGSQGARKEKATGGEGEKEGRRGETRREEGRRGGG